MQSLNYTNLHLWEIWLLALSFPTTKIVIPTEGVTGRLRRRVWQHKTEAIKGFSSEYKTTRLVYFEMYFYVRSAIAREKQIKRWRREKKIALIEAMDPQYRDLAAAWFRAQETQGPSTRAHGPRSG